MTYLAFHRAAIIPTRAVDWGPHQRGQGKRLGAGMVSGGMSAAPAGVRHYPDFEAAVLAIAPHLWPELLAILKAGGDDDVRACIGALQAGVGDGEAMRMAYGEAAE